jgi:hypothetical protein
MSLLKKAVKTPIKKQYLESEVLELTLAWIKGEITTAQASQALGAVNTQTLYIFANALRKAYQNKKVTINSR